MGEMNDVSVSEMDMHEFAMYCKRMREKWHNPQTKAERLIYEIIHNKKRKTNQEWLELQKEVRELEEIRQEEKRYGKDINCGISEEEAENFIKAVKDELGIVLPEEYLKILTTVNGIEYNGFILYGADE